MNRELLLCFFAFLLVGTSCTTNGVALRSTTDQPALEHRAGGASSAVPPNPEYGKCYAKCKTDDGEQWEVIVCKADTTPELIKDMQYKLMELSFYSGEADGKMNTETREAIIEYQKANGLPVNNMNMQTMNALGLW